MDILEAERQVCNEKMPDWLMLYFHGLGRVGQIADAQGLRFIKKEMQRVKRKYLFELSNLDTSP